MPRLAPWAFVSLALCLLLISYSITQMNVDRRIFDFSNAFVKTRSGKEGVTSHQQSLNDRSTPYVSLDITSRHTTSIAQYDGKGLIPNHSSTIIFYNRLPKCGSRSLIDLLTSIAPKNNFSVAASSDYSNPHPLRDEMLQEMKNIAQLNPNTFYHRHIHYLDFKNHAGYETPIYINIIRDPVARFVSQYNYLKYGDSERTFEGKNWSDIKDCILKDEEWCQNPYDKFCYIQYFCGFHPCCTNATSSERIKLAKKHIDEDYSVIGMTEEFDNTVKLLEKLIPTFFKGSYAVWKIIELSSMNRTKTRTQDTLNGESYRKLRYHILADDYEVYEYAKAKYERLKVKYGV